MKILILFVLLELVVVHGFYMQLMDRMFISNNFGRFLQQNDRSLLTTPPPACANLMTEYTGTEDISTEGVQAGLFESNPVYVGKAIVNGSYITITIHFSPTDGYCVYIKDKTCTKSFDFLKKVATYEYNWIPSQNGIGVYDAIDGIHAIGRIIKNSFTSIGSVQYEKGFEFVNETTHDVEFVTDGYDVLTCTVLSSTSYEPTEITTTPDHTTKFEPEYTTITETTTSYLTSIEPDYRCRYSHSPYTGSEDLSVQGIQGGHINTNPIYIGYVKIHGSMVNGPILIDPSGGYYMDNGFGNYTKDFYYFQKLVSYDYLWIESRNGRFEQNSVTGAFQVGKITKNGTDFVGSILNNLGLIYMNESSYSWYFQRDNYQVLSCLIPNVVYPTTAEPPPMPDYVPTQSCNHSWVDYTGQEDLSIDGVVAGHAGTFLTYIGLVNVSNSMLLGQIRHTAENNYCVDIGDIECTDKFKYLQKGQLYYTWKNTSDWNYYANIVISL
ncbi:unnamed protein product [Chironomus riparius]|uniref:Uncharacterized protein n=1 Tax=Chironomus riparius TaxID=315576 RepID=A0A9N9WZD2_9DIPT|nr:unnamed protein product [Chironomus riparius]